MNKLINIVKRGEWNQDSIARDILKYLSLNIGVEHVNFKSVISAIKQHSDLIKLKESCEEAMGLWYNVEIFVNDFMQVRTPCVIEGFFIDDLIYSDEKFMERYDGLVDKLNQYVGTREKILYFKYRAHRDAIQIIPANRYAGGGLIGVTIRNNAILSTGSLQPIFSSDGWYKDLTITGNIVDSDSSHLITIAGVLSGTFDENCTSSGDPVTPLLFPLRFGGGKLNIHILSFVGKDDYEDIEGVTGTPNDLRRVARRGRNVHGLDLIRFNSDYAKLDPTLTRFDRIETVINAHEAQGLITSFIL